MSRLIKIAPVIEAVAASVTALVAVAALFGVAIQLDAADALAREQAARDAYRGHLALAVAHPALAAPQDTCALLDGPEGVAYAAFVDHILYSAELTVDTDTGWADVFLQDLVPHADYLCSADAPRGDTLSINALLTTFRDQMCPATPTCS